MNLIAELALELDATIVVLVPEKRRKRMRLRVAFDQFTFEGENLMTTFPAVTKATISLKAFTGGPNPKPARLDGVPQWENSNVLAADLFVAADGLSATLTYLDEGTGQIKVTADADLGSGVRPLIGLLDYECLPGEAVVLTLEAGPVEPV